MVLDVEFYCWINQYNSLDKINEVVNVQKIKLEIFKNLYLISQQPHVRCLILFNFKFEVLRQR